MAPASVIGTSTSARSSSGRKTWRPRCSLFAILAMGRKAGRTNKQNGLLPVDCCIRCLFVDQCGSGADLLVGRGIPNANFKRRTGYQVQFSAISKMSGGKETGLLRGTAVTKY